MILCSAQVGMLREFLFLQALIGRMMVICLVLAAFLLQALVTAEPVRPLSAVGAVAISSSVVLILLNARRRAPPPLATADAAVAAAEEAELADVALRDDSPGPPRDDSPGVVK